MYGRPTLAQINPELVQTMRNLRFCHPDMTLADIANATGKSVVTVAKYTDDIVHNRRWSVRTVYMGTGWTSRPL